MRSGKLVLMHLTSVASTQYSLRVRMKIDTPFIFSSKQHGCIIALGQGHRLPAEGTAPSRQFERKNSLKCFGLLSPKWLWWS